MATYKFLGASGGPLDFYLSIDEGMGLFRLLASVSSADNISIISPDLRNGAISTAYGRINAPITGASYQFMVHCLVAAADGSPLFLKVVDGKKTLACRNNQGTILKPGPQGYQVATMKQMKPENFFSDDFRVTL